MIGELQQLWVGFLIVWQSQSSWTSSLEAGFPQASVLRHSEGSCKTSDDLDSHFPAHHFLCSVLVKQTLGPAQIQDMVGGVVVSLNLSMEGE